MKDRIIILRTIKYGESDLIIHGLNSGGGRMNFLAKSALKSRKRFGGGILEPTHYILAHYRMGSSKDDEGPLHLLTDAELIKGFQGLRENYERLEVALSMVQLIAKVAQPGVEDAPDVFDLLGNGLFAAESSHRPELLKLQFEAKLLYIQGVMPQNPALSPLLRRPLKDHALVGLAEQEVLRAQADVNSLLSRFLQGLNPLTTAEL